jgi:RNA-binding protein PNO1
MKICTPLVEHLKLDVRMNLRAKAVEMRTSPKTSEVDALQRAEDFVHAFALGFDVDDAIAIVRLDGIFIQTFDVKDVKGSLEGDHLARAIGRIAGKDGRTKFAIENTTKTRICLADSRVHILGGFKEVSACG